MAKATGKTIKVRKPKASILGKLKDLTAKYISAVLKAPQRADWAFGQRGATKKDVRKAYMIDLRNMKEVAVMIQAQESIDYINRAVSDDDDVEAIKADIKGL